MAQPSPTHGLSAAEVREREQRGAVNAHAPAASKSTSAIIRDNIFTFFNLINVVLGALVLWAGSYKNALFLGVIFFNTLIGTVQELRAKRTLDRLTLLGETPVSVIRDGREQQITPSGVVLDDIMVLKAGSQIVVDAVVTGGAAEVDESLITGESDPIPKAAGDELRSGSYITSGRVTARTVAVGMDSYANRLAAEAKVMRPHPSVLRGALNRILKAVSAFIVPLGIAYFLRQYYASGAPAKEIVVGTVAAVLGMIPEGLVLLTSVALAVGVVNLGKRKTLVRELFCIETLARVDVLCLDKTGTLTEGRMEVRAIEPLTDAPIDAVMANLAWALQDDNETLRALRRRFPEQHAMQRGEIIPFSSEHKYSGARLDGALYLVGAFEYIFDETRRDEALMRRIEAHAKDGLRVLALARGDAPDSMTPLALILVSDVIRETARGALRYFEAQGTSLVIISGDHPQTVSAIAKRLDFPGYDQYVDASTLATESDVASAASEYRIFGRVRPDQKKQIVNALKAQGHTVAMVGDGVNDVPALKAADCSVAMASGSDATKRCANLVLLDSNFDALPHVVGEGRRVINNIQSSASLFLVKTLFSVILTTLMLITSSPYPFIPIHLTLIGACAVGIPTFLFALTPNTARIEPGFFRNVLADALSGAMTVTLWVLLSALCCTVAGLDGAVRSTLSMIATGAASLGMIGRVYPMNTPFRRVVYAAMIALFVTGCLLFHGLLQLVQLPREAAIPAVAMVALTPLVLRAMHTAAKCLIAKFRFGGSI